MSLRYISSNLLFFFCLFPYMTLGINILPSDIQPFALIIAVLLLILIQMENGIVIPKLLFPTGVAISFAFLLLFIDFRFNSLRSFYGYLTIIVVSIAAYNTYEKVNLKLFKYGVVTWGFFGLIQTLFFRNFGTFLISDSRTSPTRGVTSLAVEPSAYSTMCIFFLIVNDIFLAENKISVKNHKKLFLIIVIQLLFSKSAIGFILFFIYLFSKIIAKNKIGSLLRTGFAFIVILFIVVFLFLRMPSLASTRLGHLIEIFYINPTNLLLVDHSASDRFIHIVVPFISLFTNYGLGYGYNTWGTASGGIIQGVGGYIQEVANVNYTQGERIMSGWGTVVFEMGIFGMLLLINYIYIMFKGISIFSGKKKEVYISSLITIFFTMMTAVSVSLPIFGYLLGIFVYLQNIKTTTKTSIT